MEAGELVPWFQMASTVISGIGIIVSVCLGIASLNNNRTDRLIKISPNLLFNVGGQEVPATLRPLDHIPGFGTSERDVQHFISTLPTSLLAPFLDDVYGQLYNHGSGPGLSVVIWFQADGLSTKEHERVLTKEERKSVPYIKAWNTVAAMPENLPSGEAASFGTLPICVLAAQEDVTGIFGTMYIECADQNGRSLQWSQPARYLIERLPQGKATITVSFSRRPITFA